MLPSSTVENYLKAIYVGVATLPSPQRLMPMGQLAAALAVAPGTATTMVKTLAESGLVQYEPYAGVALTAAGEKLAALVLRRHRLIELFLVRVMGYAWDEVHDEAEQLEHVVTDRLIERIDAMLGRPEVDPHGDPIPTAEGLIRRQDGDTLLTCPLGTPVTVVRVLDQDGAFLRFIEQHHLKPGESIAVEARDAAADSVRVRGRNEQRITIGTRAASKLLVRAATALVLLVVWWGPATAQTRSRELRDLSADRPDRTDTPITVDAGHVQLEMDLTNLTRDVDDAGLRSTSYEVAPMNVKVGLHDRVDVQAIYTPYRVERLRGSAAPTARGRWFTGIMPRAKINLAGNDAGLFALALIPFVGIPLDDDDDDREVEAGVGVPYLIRVPGWDVGLQTTLRTVRRVVDRVRHSEVDQSVSIGHHLAGPLSLYGEFFANTSSAAGAAWIGTTNTWLTYRVTGNLRFDSGIYIGVTSAADDAHVWVGMTWRH
jgi:DtxR family Mn-dependent transcriptional regulator